MVSQTGKKAKKAQNTKRAGKPSQKEKTTGQPQKKQKPKTEVVILVLGATGSGKSSFINAVSKSNFDVGVGLKSCTRKMQIGQPFLLGGRMVTLIDTPGLDDTSVTEADIIIQISAYITELYDLKKQLTGVIYMQRISDTRVGGTSRKNFSFFRKVVGDAYLKNVAIVTTMWNDVPKATGLSHEKELKSDPLFYQPALVKGSKMLAYTNTPKSAQTIVSYLATKRPAPVLIHQELSIGNKSIGQTTIGLELQHETSTLGQKLERELRDVQRDLAGATGEDALSELAEVQRDLDQKISDLRRSGDELTHKWQEARKAAKQDLARWSKAFEGPARQAMDEAHGGACCIVM